MRDMRGLLAIDRDSVSQEVSQGVKLRGSDLQKSFGAIEALSPTSLAVRSGEFVAIIGLSGCGKSTLLNVLAGLERPDRGRVELDGRDVTGQVGTAGYMPQKDLLMPWRTVLDNTILGLELAGTRRGAARAEALTWFPRFGLEGFERAYPSTLSGGMRQRAALLRTFLTKREVLLLDEPFGALDAITRSDMQEWLLDVWESFARTVVLVTHDVDEAIFLADRVYVMSPRPGCIVADLEVPLPRPRSYTDVVTSRPFNELKHKLLARLRGGGDRR
jgi:NitT/TauT family transport system ATP-binding protein